MGKATGNKELTLVLVTQLHHDVLAKRRTRLADIDSHVEHLALDDTYQLCLRTGTFLIVQASQDTIAGLRLIILYEVYLTDMLFEFFLLPSFKKISARVVKYAWFNDIHSFD